MNQLKHQLALLIDDTFLYLQQKHLIQSTINEPLRGNITPIFIEPHKPPSPEIKESKIEINPLPEPNVVLKYVEENKSKWELLAMAPPEELLDIKVNFSKFFTMKEPEISIYLMLPEENSAHRLFLENVARAITSKLAPASVVLTKNFQKNGKLFCAPNSLLKKKHPDLQCHQLYDYKDYSLLPLEEIHLYFASKHLKWALWKALKNYAAKITLVNSPL